MTRSIGMSSHDAKRAMLTAYADTDVRDYIRWFAPYQFADGKIPCCVDEHGATPVPGPTMMMSLSAAGRAKCLLGLSFTRTLLPRLMRSAA